MDVLVILGNGFDLSHGLRTSYYDFIKHEVDNFQSKKKQDRFFANKLMNSSCTFKFEHLAEGRKIIGGVNYFATLLSRKRFNNALFIALLNEFADKNWCDIEYFYYEQLASDIWYPHILSLHNDFEAIKSHLQSYLKQEQTKAKKMASYAALFSELSETGGWATILNFNYTSVLDLYEDELARTQVINIHGELYNEENPIVFGYAASDEEARELIERNDNEFLRNIKKHCYKRTNNFKKLNSYLDTDGSKTVIIIGHSCGISDKLILNQIFNHPKVRKILPFYYENHESYFQTQVNMDRIMNNDDNFNSRLVSSESSWRTPQYNDNEEQIKAFQEYLFSDNFRDALEH